MRERSACRAPSARAWRSAAPRPASRAHRAPRAAGRCRPPSRPRRARRAVVGRSTQGDGSTRRRRGRALRGVALVVSGAIPSRRSVAKHPYLPAPLRRRVLGSPWLQRSLWAIEALAVAMTWGLLRALGPDRAVRAARAVTSRVGPRLRKSRNVRANLAIMFPEKSGAERAVLEREMWGEWGALFA